MKELINRICRSAWRALATAGSAMIGPLSRD
jgi:hypothetical protein